MEKKWVLKETDEPASVNLQRELQIHPALCKLLVQRNITTFEEAKQFFRTSADHLHDPFLMKGMEIAVQRIKQAIDKNESILIYGDYDVDGTTAVAVVYKYLCTRHANLSYYIPHRFTEGYGLSQKGLDYAIANNISLIITLDCGIKSTKLIAEAKIAGIDTIVCDHHMPDDELPPAFAILNPKQKDCLYPYKELCGCGVGYKLISAYAQRYENDHTDLNDLLDLVATAIAADIVPVTGENRTLCVLGLKKANENPSLPLQALRYINALEKEFTINDLVFIIAPRVNAAGRMDDARKAVELFLADDFEQAKVIAEQLHEKNNDRRDVDRTTTAEALELIEQGQNKQLHRSTVVYQPHWHKGVVGIVASRLIEHHYKPTIVLTHSEGKITGSARSIKGFNLFEGLNLCAEYLDNWGGHYFAAGLTLREENLAAFREKFNAVIDKMVPEIYFQPTIDIDAELSIADIQENFLRILKQFAPHGPENMKPIFLSKGVQNDNNQSAIVKEKHIRFLVRQPGSNSIKGIGFNLADKFHILSKPTFDILYQLEENTWNGQQSVQLKVLDIR
jgi:single-stranded-DNA-specific exonuclease